MFNLSKSKHLNFVAAHRSAEKMVGGLFPLKKRRRFRRVYKILKYFGLILLILFLVLLIFFSTKILSLKELYSQAMSGQANLEQALISAGQAEFGQAMTKAAAAENNFNYSIDELNSAKAGYFAEKFPLILSQLNDLESLLTAGKFLSRAAYNGADFSGKIESLAVQSSSGAAGGKKPHFLNYAPAAKRQVLKKIFESAPELNGIKADLDLAYLTLNQVNQIGALSLFKEKISQTKKRIESTVETLEKAAPLSQLLPALAGYPEPAEYLVVLQDNGELRPTGGILESYGILRFKDGELADFDTHDIYSLRVGDWSWRDANWSPDWPTAAQKIDWFYRQSGGSGAVKNSSQFDGVIALTPKLIADFLKTLGPVTVSGQAYDQINFLALSELEEEEDFFRQKNETIGEIIKAILNKIFALPANQWTKIINLTVDNIAAKNLLLYFNDRQLENIAMANGWGGEIKSTAGDYLMVVDANLVSEKTDAMINRSLIYKVTQTWTGLSAKLNLNYSYRGGPDKKAGSYKSYTRVYAPLGSKLVDFSGGEPAKVEIGGESGKTWFGFYLTIEPGEIKNLTIEYDLPALVYSPKNYQLYLQKQPGKEINEATVDLSFPNDIKSYNPVSLYNRKLSPSRIRWEGDLSIDRNFEVKF